MWGKSSVILRCCPGCGIARTTLGVRPSPCTGIHQRRFILRSKTNKIPAAEHPSVGWDQVTDSRSILQNGIAQLAAATIADNASSMQPRISLPRSPGPPLYSLGVIR